MNRVYFPLRSNVAWFQSQDLREVLDVRLKETLLLYDEVIIEDGTFVADITEEGGYYPYYPPGYLPDDQRVIIQERDIKPTEFRAGIKLSNSDKPYQTLISDKTIARYKIDYFDILQGSDLSTADSVKFMVVQDHNLSQEARQAINSETFRDRQYFTSQFRSHWIRDFVLKNLNRDTIVASLMQAAVIVDPTHDVILREKCKIERTSVPPGGGGHLALQHILAVAAPNFSEMTIDEVLELRNDSSWSDFRAFLRNLVDDVMDDPFILTNSQNFQEKVGRNFSQALLEELRNRYPTGRSLLIDVGLGVTSVCPV